MSGNGSLFIVDGVKLYKQSTKQKIYVINHASILTSKWVRNYIAIYTTPFLH